MKNINLPKKTHNYLEPNIKKIISELQNNDPELLKGVKDKNKLAQKLAVSISHQTKISSYHQGPLPPPSILNDYNKIIPNGAERIMSVFEQQSSHRIKLENKVVSSQISQSSIGQLLGFVIAMTCLIIGTLLVLKGFNTAGITIFSLDIVSLTSVFVIGKKFQEKKLNKKSDK